MMPIGAGITAAAFAVAGTVALTVVLLTPPPSPPSTVWIDQPGHNSSIIAGPTLIAVHGSSERQIRQFRLLITAGSQTVAVLNDTTPDAVSYGSQAKPLSSGSVEWDAQPGTYRVTASYLDTAEWVTAPPVVVTVLDGTPVLPESPDGIPLPNSPDDGFEPSTPTDPEFEPIPEPDPVDPEATLPPPTVAPTSAPAPTSTAAPSIPPAGTVRRTFSGSATVFVADGVNPQNAIVDVQYQITNDYNGPANPAGSWTSLGCGNLSAQPGSSPTRYTCTTATWSAPGRSSSYRTGHVRVQVTAGGTTWTSYGSDWLIDPSIS